MGVQIVKDGYTIKSVDDWFRLAPPKEGKKHWVDGRSAKELAKAWFSKSDTAFVPSELAELLSSNPDLAGTTIREAEPEARIKLDNYRGETRNADLVLCAERNGETIIITVEAKADELFDVTIEDKLRSAKVKSNVPKRIDHLCQALFGAALPQRPCLGELSYQLLHGVAATLIAARQKCAAKAVFVVHEFATNKTDPEKLKQNHGDLVAFVSELSKGKTTTIEIGRAAGPFEINGGGHVPKDTPLYIGKIRRTAPQ
jgi:hypothetical protein